MHLIECLQSLEASLSTAGLDHPRLDAELILTFVLKQSRTYLYMHPELLLSAADQDHVQLLLARRLQGEPIAYILGSKEFWSLELQVSHDVLIPRPDTELLVDTVLQYYDHQEINLVDLGTGSGAIAIALAHERPAWKVSAVDVSQNALKIAKNNAHRLGLDRISFYQGSWLTALPQQQFDVIVTNPPYIAEVEWPEYEAGLACEPKQALVSGRDGLDAIKEIASTAQAFMKPGAGLFIEHGFEQGEKVRVLLKSFGYVDVQTAKDLAQNERITFAFVAKG